jgi:hypothetical protein
LQEALADARHPTDLEEFLLVAVERNEAAFSDALASSESDPRSAGYRSGVWTFLSMAKGRPELESHPVWEVARIVGEILEPHGGWELLPAYDVFGAELDPRDAFIDAWDSVKEPLRCDPVPRDALPLVERWPLESERWSDPDDVDYKRLVSLCFYYALLRGDRGRFFLSCRTAGELLGVSHTTAAAYLRRACKEGLLELTQQGTRFTGKASEFRFRFGSVDTGPSHGARVGQEG